MSDGEKLFLWLLAIGLAAIVLFELKGKRAAPSDPGQPLTPADLTQGPAYLTFNQPWAFAPPIGNFLPPTTVGQVGQTVANPSAIEAPCGC